MYLWGEEPFTSHPLYKSLQFYFSWNQWIFFFFHPQFSKFPWLSHTLAQVVVAFAEAQFEMRRIADLWAPIFSENLFYESHFQEGFPAEKGTMVLDVFFCCKKKQQKKTKTLYNCTVEFLIGQKVHFLNWATLTVNSALRQITGLYECIHSNTLLFL